MIRKMFKLSWKLISVILAMALLWPDFAQGRQVENALRQIAFGERRTSENPPPEPVQYIIKRSKKEGPIWAMAISLKKNLSTDAMVEHIKSYPMDSLMIYSFIDILGKLPKKNLKQLMKTVRQKTLADERYYTPLACIYLIARGKSPEIAGELKGIDTKALEKNLSIKPLAFLLDQEETLENAYWNSVFDDNRNRHYELPQVSDEHLPLFGFGEAMRIQPVNAIRHLGSSRTSRPLHNYTTLRESTTGVMTNRVLDCPLLLDYFDHEELQARSIQELFFSASIPFGFSSSTLSGANNTVVTSKNEYAWGKGFTKEQALDSCYGELAERICAAGSFRDGQTAGYTNEYQLHKCSYNELTRNGNRAIDLNSFNLFSPYKRDWELYWVEGEDSNGVKIYVPAQLAFLFANLDEYKVIESETTGLSSGNTMNEAKLQGICEVVERDAVATGLWSRQKTFTLETQDAKIAPILDTLNQNLRLDVRFLDLTNEYGIPVYMAYLVHGNKVMLVGGYGAHLDGRIALARAFGELLISFSVERSLTSSNMDEGNAGGVRKFEELPNYSTGTVTEDLRVLERLLNPVYINLTRKGVDIPVVRVIIPGTDFINAKSSKRLFRNYYRTMLSKGRMPITLVKSNFIAMLQSYPRRSGEVAVLSAI